MKITEKHKMSDMKNLSPVINLDKDFLDKVRAFEVPERIDEETPRHVNEIQIQHLLLTWNITSNDDLLKMTKKAFGLTKPVEEYPLIDFLRLSLELSDLAEWALEMFTSLKRTNPNSAIQSILEGFSTSNLELIDRFVTRSNGAYTYETASEASWMIVYTAFKVDTDEYDKQLAISELHGT